MSGTAVRADTPNVLLWVDQDAAAMPIVPRLAREHGLSVEVAHDMDEAQGAIHRLRPRLCGLLVDAIIPGAGATDCQPPSVFGGLNVVNAVPELEARRSVFSVVSRKRLEPLPIGVEVISKLKVDELAKLRQFIEKCGERAAKGA